MVALWNRSFIEMWVEISAIHTQVILEQGTQHSHDATIDNFLHDA